MSASWPKLERRVRKFGEANLAKDEADNNRDDDIRYSEASRRAIGIIICAREVAARQRRTLRPAIDRVCESASLRVYELAGSSQTRYPALAIRLSGAIERKRQLGKRVTRENELNCNMPPRRRCLFGGVVLHPSCTGDGNTFQRRELNISVR